MMNQLPPVVLLVSGGALTVLGSWRVVDPVSFLAMNELAVDGTDISLINELRGMGSMPFGFGLIILSGLFFPKTMRKTSLICSNVVFWTFLSARILSSAWDGLPNPKIVEGMGFEFLLGCLNVIALWKFGTAKEKDKTA
jgi:hypothetical protein